MKCKRVTVMLLMVACALLWVCPVAAAPSTTLTVGTVTAAPGATVTVPVSASVMDGVGAVGIYIKYDTAVLECLGARAVGLMNNMDTNSANTKPAGRSGEVWLTGMTNNALSGGGELMQVTFKVKEGAPEGLSVIEYVSDKPNQLILMDYTLYDVTAVTGGVVVTNQAATPATTTTATTTAPSGDTAPSDDTTTVVSNVDATTAPTTPKTYTRPNGETIEVTEGTVVDSNGTVVTMPGGEPLMVKNIAVMVGEAKAMPGDRVTVKVSVTEVTDLATFGVNVSYDPQALTFVGGEAVGFIKAEMNAANVVNNQEGIVSISGMDPIGVSGEGEIASLTFEVKRSAKAGDYRLGLQTSPLFVTKQGTEVPTVTYGGEVAVEADGVSVGWIVGAVGAVAAVAAVVAVVVLLRRKKAKAA